MAKGQTFAEIASFLIKASALMKIAVDGAGFAGPVETGRFEQFPGVGISVGGAVVEFMHAAGAGSSGNSTPARGVNGLAGRRRAI